MGDHRVVQIDNWKFVKDRKGGVCLTGTIGTGHRELKPGTDTCTSRVRRIWGRKYVHTENTHYRLGKPAKASKGCRC